MLNEFWRLVRGHAVRIAVPGDLRIFMQGDDDDLSSSDDAPPPRSEAVSGLGLIIDYRDSKGRQSCRRVTCQRLEQAGAITYLRAWCHERGAGRQFRIDHIETLYDVETGEVIADPAFFERYRIDESRQSGLTWGLSVRRRADLIGGINVLVFIARCDREWHPLETNAIEGFITSLWLRREYPGDIPIADILAHAKRLRPDAESFYGALQRCLDTPDLARTIRRHIAAVIDADGRIAPEEVYWGQQVDELFSTSGL